METNRVPAASVEKTFEAPVGEKKDTSKKPPVQGRRGVPVMMALIAIVILVLGLGAVFILTAQLSGS